MKRQKYTSEELMRSAPVLRSVLALSLPTLLGSLVGLVYNLTDTFFIGLLNDYAQTAALSLAMPVPIIVGALGTLVSAGAPSYISRKYGGGEMQAVRQCSSFAFWITLALGAAATAAILPAMDPMLILMGASDATLAHAGAYLKILIAFTVVNLMQGTLQGLLRAEGETKAASFGSILGIITNIALDPVMILWLDMGIRGAALATAAGYVISAVYFLAKLRRKNTVLSIRPRDCRTNRAMLKDILLVGSASSLSSLIVCVPLMLGNRFAAGYSDYALAAIGISTKVFTVLYTMIAGFSMGLQPFIGYNYGAGQTKRMLDGMRFSALLGTGMCLLAEALFAFLPAQLIGAFSSDSQVIAFGVRMLRYFLISVPFAALQMVATTFLTASGRAIQAMLLTLVKQIVLFIPLMLILQRFMGIDGLMLGQPLADLAATALALMMTVHSLKGTKSFPKPSETA